MKKISVIVPVYNVEDLLERSVQSLVSQTYNNIEIILVNDGSTDASGHICEDMRGKYSNVKVIHQGNQGVSAARNRGIKDSTGDYIGFVDADDTAMNTMYEDLVHLAEKYSADIVSCNAILSYENKEISINVDNDSFVKYENREAILRAFLEDQCGGEGVWNKLFKRSVVNNVLFDTALKHNEDKLFLFQAILNSKKYVHTNRNLYLYYQRNGSATKGDFSPSLFDVEIVTERIENLVDSKYSDLSIKAKQSSLLALSRLYRTLLLVRTDEDMYKAGVKRVREKIIGYKPWNRSIELFFVQYMPWLFRVAFISYTHLKNLKRYFV